MLEARAWLGQVPLVLGPSSWGAQAAMPPGTAPVPPPRMSPGRNWWMHHIRNTRAIGEAHFNGDTQGELRALGELWQAVKDWERLTGSPVAGVLMGEHTVLVKLLVDCLPTKNEACINSAVQGLMRNVDSQRALFPREAGAFADLFGPHTQIAGAYLTDFSQGKRNDGEAEFAEALRNGAQLGDFTDRVFFGR